MQCKTIPSQENSSRRSGSAWCGRKRAPPPLRNTCGMRRLLPPGWTAGRRPRRRRGPGRPPCWRRSWRRPPSTSSWRRSTGSLVFLGWPAFRVKPLRIQRRLFRDDSRELTRPEYLRLLETARTQGRERLALLLETICGTGNPGVRGALCHRGGRVPGKGRNLLEGQDPDHPAAGQALPQAPQIRQETKIASGEIFLTRNEKASPAGGSGRR